MRSCSSEAPATLPAAVPWILRLALFGCYVGHGAFGVITKAAWVPYFGVLGIPAPWAWRLMPWVGVCDITFGFVVFLWPCRAFFAWAVVWTFWTALLRPLAGQGWWEFIERAGNYGAPLALLVMAGVRGRWLVRLRNWGGPGWTAARDHALAWALRVAGALLLCGHAGYGLVMRKALLEKQYAAIWSGAPAGLERGIGAGEFALAGLVLLRPSAPLVFLACGWKLASELLYPATGAPVWEVIERAGSYGVLLALAVLLRNQTARNFSVRPGNPFSAAGDSPA